ncbi:hypothetical protein KPHVMX_350151 [Klebsiella pneumoniae]|nr:hypothetical protein KPHVMX_350151 [Klebsiella pneumoniae]
MFSLIVLVWKKSVIYQIAQTVDGQHVHLLDTRAAMGGDADFDILLT